MHLLSASDLGHDVAAPAGVRTLFDDLSFGLTSDDTVAIVGPNGSGKSTLLRILVGEVTPTRGEVVPSRRARIAWLPQRDDTPDATRARDAAMAQPGVAGHEAEALLDQFGIDPDRTLGTLSGGQRRRVTLVAALAAPSDLLVLDEPTNHLDVEAIERLEDHLEARAGGLVLVTHDRMLLDRLATRLLDLHDTPTWVDGTYRDVLAARADRAAARDRLARARRSQLRRELAWLQRAPKARGTKADFRVEQARELQAAVAADEAGEDTDLVLTTGRRRLGTKVLDVEGLAVSRGGHAIARDLELHLGPGDRIGFVGANGAGKTTLLATLDEHLAPDAGTVEWGPTVQRATFHQQASAAPSDERVLDTVLAIAPRIPLADGTDLPAARLAERFGFDDRLQHARVADLSGGERRRLGLLHLLVGAPNVLVLDEPTNDLDLDTLRALEDHLEGFDGTVLVASHDRMLLERVCTRLFGLHDGRVVEVADIAAWRDLVRRDGGEVARTDASEDDSAAANTARLARSRQVRSLARRMDRLTDRASTLEAAMAAAGPDVEEATRLHRELQAVRAELSGVEDAWLEAST